MIIVKKIFHFLFFLILFFLTFIFTFLYLYDYYPFIQKYILNNFEEIDNLTSNIFKLLDKHQIKPVYGILGILGILIIYFFIKILFRKKRKEKIIKSTLPPFVFFIFPFIFFILIGVILFIYYSPHNVIKIGNLFTINRGPRDVFLGKIIHIGILILAGHLLFFNLSNIYLIIRIKGKKK